jgi:hypothetical protein
VSFSWIIPVGPDESEYLIERCLSRTIDVAMPEDELVVVCSGTQGALVKKLVGSGKNVAALQIVEHPPVYTPGAARNAGIERAKNDRIIFQDIDDVPHINRRKLCELHLTEPKSIFSGGYNVLHNGAEIGSRVPRDGSDMFFFRTNLFLPASAVYLDEKRYFRENLAIGEDTVFFANLISAGFKVVRKQELLVDYEIIDAKILGRNGVKGVRNELAFRRALVGSKIRRRAKAFTIVGGLVISAVKMLPKKLFVRVYLHFHAR